MEYMNYTVKNNADFESKPRVYFTCHPKDFNRCFEKICDDILKNNDCIIYYTPDMAFNIPDENKETDIGRMNMFVIPVTFQLLSTPNRALDEDFKYAQENNIPVLPIIIEHGLEEIYSKPDKFGELQFLDAYNRDLTAISYEDKLKKYLDSVLFSEETTKKVRAAFDSYIFLSYRKIDRAYANELMHMIHKNPICRSIAIWYDEFLTPGRDFNEGIQKALEKSELFALLVTKNLLQKGNYVQRIEYPEARKAGKKIVPVDMDDIGSERFKSEFAEDAPNCIDGKREDIFQNELLKTVRRLGLAKDKHDSVHNFLIGLAYLNGIDVEVDRIKAVELITSAAESDLPEAMEKLCNMYEDAIGVERNYSESLKWAKHLADYYVKEYGEEAPDTLTKLNNLSLAYWKLGNYQKALEVSEKAYDLRCKVSGKEHSDTILTLGNLAFIYGYLGNYQKEIEIEAKVYNLRCKVLGEEHPYTLLALHNLSMTYDKLGDYKKEYYLIDKVYQLRCKVLGEEHPDTLLSLGNLASTYGKLGNYQKEIEIETRVYNLRCKVLGEEHPYTLLSLGNLAAAYGHFGDFQKELELEEKVYQLKCKHLGEEHPDTLLTLSNIAMTHRSLGNYENAVEVGERAYNLRCKVLGEDHPDTLTTLGNLAAAYGNVEQYQIAAELAEKVYNLRCEIFGMEHPSTLLALNNLACAYIDLDEFKKVCKSIIRYIWIIAKHWVKEKYIKMKQLILRNDKNSNQL